MNHRKKLISQQRSEEQQQAATGQEAQQQTAREFASAEAMLRHDALHTPVPPAIAQRLQESLAHLPSPPPRSWWQRFFGEPKS